MRKKTHLCLISIGLACGIAACDAPTAQSENPAEVQKLQKQIQDLSAKVADLTKVVDANEASRKWDNGIAQFDRIAYLTPGSDGYSVIRTDLGNLTIAIDDIKPYANGSKVRLNFGNVLVATINGLKMTIDWGRMSPIGGPDNQNQKSREITFSQPLLPGAWTKVEIVLEGIPPSDLGFVRVKDVTHTGIVLRR
jgi:hypothetical protein